MTTFSDVHFYFLRSDLLYIYSSNMVKYTVDITQLLAVFVSAVTRIYGTVYKR